MQGSKRRSLPVVVVSLTVILTTWERNETRAADHFLEISRSDSGFTVEAEGATLTEILKELGDEAGFTIRDSGAEQPRIPLFEVRNAPLETTIRQLLGDTNHLILYRGEPENKTIDKIILLSPGEKRDRARAVVSSLAGPGAKPKSEKRDEARASPPAATRPDDEPDQLFEEEQWEDDREDQLAYGRELEEQEFESIEQIQADPRALERAERQLPPEVIEALRGAGSEAEVEALLAGERVEPLVE